MTARQLRESPRMILAGVAMAVALVLVGVLIGSATAGGSTGSTGSANSANASLRQRTARQAAQLHGAEQTIAGLRAQVATAMQSLGSTRTQLTTARTRARCWRNAALHRTGGRVPSCAART